MSCFETHNEMSIRVVQGDTVTKTLTFKKDGQPLGSETIEAVKFTSATLNLNITLTYDATNIKYILTIPSSTTINLLPGIASFDITITFVGGNVFTQIHNGTIVVEKKDNPIPTT